MDVGAALLEAAHALADPVAIFVHRGLDRGAGGTTFGGRNIGHHALGIIGRREERRRPAPPWAQLLAGFAAPYTNAGIGLHIEVRIIVDGLAGLRIDALRPGDLLLILVGAQELTARAIKRVVEA